MNDAIVPRYSTIDGLSIRFGQRTPDPDNSHRASPLSPWPASVYAFDRVWSLLSHHARLTTIDPPGLAPAACLGSMSPGQTEASDKRRRIMLRSRMIEQYTKGGSGVTTALAKAPAQLRNSAGTGRRLLKSPVGTRVRIAPRAQR
jgi:hypothetical protein